MSLRLKGKKCLVTGGSRGIGEGIALAFASEGADVAVTGRNLCALQPVLDKIRGFGVNAAGFAWDVARVKEAKTQILKIAEGLGGLDVVVNNAGVVVFDDFFKQTEESWDYVMNADLKAVYFICQAAAEYMIERQLKGRIINIASDSGLKPAVTLPYGIAKCGVARFTCGLAKMLFPKGITVNAIAPGPVSTEMMNVENGKITEWPGSAFGRYALPSEIGQLAVFLASEESARIAGEVIAINGNM